MRHVFLFLFFFVLIFCSGPVRKVSDSTNRQPDTTTFQNPADTLLLRENKVPTSSQKYQNQWESYAKMPFPNNAFAIEGNERTVYLAGGYTPKGYSNAFFAYDTATNIWKRLPDLPKARAGLTLTLAGKYLYALGGINEKGPSKQTDIFDLEKNEWQEGPSMLLEHFQHSAILINEEIWVCGGLPFKKEVEYFSLESRNWKKGPELKYGRDSHRALLLSGKLHLLGGKNITIQNEIASLNPSKNQWEYYFQLPASRFGFFSLNYKELVLILGGFRDTTATSYFGDVFLLHLSQGTMQPLKSLPSGLANFGAYRYKNQIYVFGGRNHQGIQDTVWRMDID